MEHRWGQRIPVKLPVRLVTESGEPVIGETENISISGALIQTARSVRLFSRLQVEVVLPREYGNRPELVAAHVTRKIRDGAAIEWCDFAPHAVRALLRAFGPPAACAASAPLPVFRRGWEA
jgi:hypothetical protein